MSTKRVTVQILKNGRDDWPCVNALVSGRTTRGNWVDAISRTDDRGYATIEWEYGADYLERICVDARLESNRYIDGPFEAGYIYRGLNYQV